MTILKRPQIAAMSRKKPMSGLEPLTPSLRATLSEEAAVYLRPCVGMIDLQIAEILLDIDGLP